MKYIEQENAKKICDSCLEIGKRVDNDKICCIAKKGLEDLNRSSKTTIAFVANDIGTLSKIAVDTLGFQFLLSSVTRVAAPIQCSYSFSDVDEYADFMTANNDEKCVLENRVCADVLRQFNIVMYAANGDFEAFDWKNELRQIDYLFLGVSALQLFSSSERDFVEKCIKTQFGLSRFSVIVSDMDKINTLDNLNEVKERIAWYLESVGMGENYYQIDSEELKNYINDDLFSQAEELRKIAFSQIAYLCCEDVEGELNEMLETANIDFEELKKQIEILKSREEKMRTNGQLLANSIHNSITGNVIYNATIAARKYVNQMENDIRTQLDTTSNLKDTVALIPDYVKSACQQLGRALSQEMGNETAIMDSKIQSQMEKDAGEFFEGVPEWALNIISDSVRYLSPLESVVEAFEVDSQNAISNASKEKAKKISKVLLIASVPALVVSGLPLAIGTVAASHFVKKIPFESNNIDVEKLKSSVNTDCYELLSDIEKELHLKGEEMGERASKSITEAYSRFISNILDRLAFIASEAEKCQRKMDVIANEKLKTIPELKSIVLE